MRIVASLFPNGELRVRRLNRVPSKVSSDRSERALAHKSEFQETRYEMMSAIAGLPEKVKPGWGMTPRFTRFGLRAKRTLQRVGGEIGKNGGRRVAITFTLPGSNSEAMQAMADYSGYIANRVKTWIFDKLAYAGRPDWFYVWELQERGALHLHFCVQCDFLADYWKLKQEGKAFWIRVMKTVQSKSGARMALSWRGIDWFEKPSEIQYYCQIVRSGVGNYFAKYLGKDNGKAGRHVRQGLRPSRWWGCSRSLLQRMRENTIHLVGDEMSEGQSWDFMELAHSAISEEAEVCHARLNEWNGDLEIIAYGNDMLPAMIAIESVLNQNKSCLVEARLMNGDKDVDDAVKYFRDIWKKNEGRLRLAEVIGTDSYYWELLSRLMIDRSCVPDAQILQLKEFVENEEQAQRDAARDSGTYVLQYDLFGGVSGLP